MANRQKGEVSLSVEGQIYTFVLTIDAMVALEDMFSTPQREVTFQQVADRSIAGSVKHTRGLIWASLQEHHPDLTLKDVSNLIQQAGGVFAFSEKLQQLQLAAAADPKDIEELGLNGNPRKAQAKSKKRVGTGASSIATLGRSA